MMYFNSLIRSMTRCNTRSIFSTFMKRYDFGECSNLINAPGAISSERPVPDHIPKPPYYDTRQSTVNWEAPIEIKSAEQIVKMRASCHLAAQILAQCKAIVQVGTTTDQIDEFVHNETIAAGAYPSPLRYNGFPKSVCTSVNNVSCHGIPDDRPLCDGDIVNVDVTVFLDGHHGDCSETFLVGAVDDRGKYLVQSTRECLELAIRACGPDRPLNAIGMTIGRRAAELELSVLPQFIGHGIGAYFHGPPEVLPYENDLGGVMRPGMTFTIEPILTLGDVEIEIWDDGWTAVTTDGGRSAQFEHTVLITETGVEVLTRRN